MSVARQAETKRFLLKISGEALSGVGKHDFDQDAIDYIAKEIVLARKDNPGVELAIMVGGGNLIRGSRLAGELGITPVIGDQAGMLSTIINAIILQDVLEHRYATEAHVATSLQVDEVAEPFRRRKVMSHLNKGRVVMLAGGTGTPRFTTDTGTVLKAIEIEANMVLKATKVDGVYDKDPNGNDGPATIIPSISHKEVVERGLRIMDLTSVTLAAENKIDIIVFNLFTSGNLSQVLSGKTIGSRIAT